MVTIAKKLGRHGTKVQKKSTTLSLSGKVVLALGAFDVQPGPLRTQTERKTDCSYGAKRVLNSQQGRDPASVFGI